MAARLYRNAHTKLTVRDSEGRTILAGTCHEPSAIQTVHGDDREVELVIEMDRVTEHNAAALIHMFNAPKTIGVIGDHHASMDKKRTDAIMDAIANASFKDSPMIGDFINLPVHKFVLPELSETEKTVLESIKGMVRRAGMSNAAKAQQDYRDAKNLMFASFYGGPGVQQQAVEDWRKARAAWTSLSAFEGYDKIQLPSGKERTIAYFDLGDNW